MFEYPYLVINSSDPQLPGDTQCLKTQKYDHFYAYSGSVCHRRQPQTTNPTWCVLLHRTFTLSKFFAPLCRLRLKQEKAFVFRKWPRQPAMTATRIATLKSTMYMPITCTVYNPPAMSSNWRAKRAHLVFN